MRVDVIKLIVVIILVLIVSCLIIYFSQVLEADKIGGADTVEINSAYPQNELFEVTLEPFQEPPTVKLNCDGHKLAIDRGEMFYEFGDNGFDKGRPSLLLINGGPGGTHVYFHGLKDLGSRCDSNVIMYDQRGCGQSSHSDEPYSINGLVDDIEALRRHLDVDKFAVLGWSYGGYLARAYALKYPDKVSHLIMVSSITAGFTDMVGDEYRADQKKYITEPERTKLREIARMDAPLDVKIFNMMLNGDWKRQYLRKPDKPTIALQAKFGWDHDERFRNDILKDLNHSHEAVKNLNIPVLIIEGRYDLTFAPKKLEEFPKHFKNPVVAIFEGSAHSTFVDEKDLFEKTVCEFVTG